MAWPDNAVALPVKGQACDFCAVIFSSSTGNPLTGALADLEGYVGVDDAAFATTGVTVANPNTDGFVHVSIDATRMNGKVIKFRIQTSTANAMYACGEIRTLDLSEPTGHWLLATVKKLEQGVVQGFGYLLNKVKRNVDTGTLTYYKLDETTAVGTMTADTTPVANEVTKGELT
jgi:hypothetical protein